MTHIALQLESIRACCKTSLNFNFFICTLGKQYLNHGLCDGSSHNDIMHL